jgi:glucokinase
MAPSPVVLGIDIGGTTTSFAIVERDGKCLVQEVHPTRAEEPASRLVSRISERFREVFPPFSETYALTGVGIGAPNANYYTGIVEHPPNLNWGPSVNLAGLFRDAFALPVAVTNDANAAAIGEMEFGAARGMRHFIVITLGTGVGSGIVVNGEILYGADGFAGEIGHTVVDPQGRRCACGKRGCLEAYASAAGLCRTVMTLLADQMDDSELRRFSIRDLTARDVFEAASRGDEIARDAFRETGRILGMKLADAVAFTSPEAIFLFGGLAAAGELLFEPTRRSLEAHLLNIYRGKVRLLASGLRDGNAAVLGAAALIWRELETGASHHDSELSFIP